MGSSTLYTSLIKELKDIKYVIALTQHTSTKARVCVGKREREPLFYIKKKKPAQRPSTKTSDKTRVCVGNKQSSRKVCEAKRYLHMLSVSIPSSLSLSLSHTHTHTHTRTDVRAKVSKERVLAKRPRRKRKSSCRITLSYFRSVIY